MNNQSRGRTGNRQLPASLTELALNIIRNVTPILDQRWHGKNSLNITVLSLVRKRSDGL